MINLLFIVQFNHLYYLIGIAKKLLPVFANYFSQKKHFNLKVQYYQSISRTEKCSG